MSRDVKQHVETALEWERSVDTRDLSVSVEAQEREGW